MYSFYLTRKMLRIKGFINQITVLLKYSYRNQRNEQNARKLDMSNIYMCKTKKTDFEKYWLE